MWKVMRGGSGNWQSVKLMDEIERIRKRCEMLRVLIHDRASNSLQMRGHHKFTSR